MIYCIVYCMTYDMTQYDMTERKLYDPRYNRKKIV